MEGPGEDRRNERGKGTEDNSKKKEKTEGNGDKATMRIIRREEK